VLIESHGCSVVLRRFDGIGAREFFLLCEPLDTDASDGAGHAEAAYRAILDVLDAEGAGEASIVRETLFLRSLKADLDPVRGARRRILAFRGEPPCAAAVVAEIEQPPLDERARLQVLVQALLPLNGLELRRETIEARSACRCAECARARGLRIRVGEQIHFHAGGLYGAGENAYEQALAMFSAAEGLLQRAGMTFHDVVRTWIHLRDIDRDYTALNHARRDFFAARRIDPAPASTGIGAGLVPAAHDLCLGLYAIRSDDEARPVQRAWMSAPTLNEAPSYGSDFTRGMRVVETHKVGLYVSGTASIDEAGRTAHPGNFDAQVDRMLVNVVALLARQGASVADVVSAVTYLKRPADALRLRQKLRDAGFEGFPNALVVAPICRSDLLCETELIAVSPLSGSRARS
jgi:enamine deaminase RidA (YjgF/YER057c/UK114 family)